MNYRHAFHAGNAVDVAKHVVLVALLGALQRKPAPYAYIETHAGRGRYALDAEIASRTAEAGEGIQVLRMHREVAVAGSAIARYLELIDAENPGLPPTAAARRYPGSPALALALARPFDRALFCEQQPEEAAALERTVGARANAEVRCVDGWRELAALLPPRERRGMVLIDPPYEAADDWKRAAEGMLGALTRWPSGVLVVWYPLKANAEAAGLEHRIEDKAPTKVLRAAFRTRPDGPGLQGCGLLIANPPFALAEQLNQELSAVAQTLAGRRGSATVDWLVPERD